MAGVVLFDVDGVLLDSIPSYARAWRCFADEHGLDFEALRAGATGRRPLEIVQRALPSEAERWSDLLEGFEAHVLREQATVGLMAGAERLLETLPRGRFAFVSSSSRRIVEASFSRLGIAVPEGSVFGEDVVCGKPDPSCYVLAAYRLGAPSKSVLVVEDAPAGIKAALAAGMQVLALATTHASETLAEAHAVAPNLAEATERILAWTT
jgi:sugar-phosphatase